MRSPPCAVPNTCGFHSKDRGRQEQKSSDCKVSKISLSFFSCLFLLLKCSLPLYVTTVLHSAYIWDGVFMYFLNSFYPRCAHPTPAPSRPRRQKSQVIASCAPPDPALWARRSRPTRNARFVHQGLASWKGSKVSRQTARFAPPSLVSWNPRGRRRRRRRSAGTAPLESASRRSLLESQELAGSVLPIPAFSRKPTRAPIVKSALPTPASSPRRERPWNPRSW